MTTLRELADQGRLDRDVPLAPLTTYKFGGGARFFAEVTDDDELGTIAACLASDPQPILVLGRGSNLVVSDTGFDGVVVRLGGRFLDIAFGKDGVVTAGGAVPLPVLARRSVKEGRRGLEFFVGIPGSVGGAVMMNAGCHGSDTAAVLISADVMDLGDGRVERLTPEELEMSYRHSNLDDRSVVIRGRFATEPGDPEAGEAVLREITQWRRDNQPGGTFNAGSVFKNPQGDSAGRIIDAAGLKGFRVGGASVSERHANFFVADEDATAQDVYDLVYAVRARVGERWGIWLEPEVRFAGTFRVSPDEGAGPASPTQESAQ